MTHIIVSYAPPIRSIGVLLTTSSELYTDFVLVLLLVRSITNPWQPGKAGLDSVDSVICLGGETSTNGERENGKMGKWVQDNKEIIIKTKHKT